MKIEFSLCVVLLTVCAVVKGAAVHKQVKVITKAEEVTYNGKLPAILNCDYVISSGEDLPVTVTWFQGDGPRSAGKVLSCTGYTKLTKSCYNHQVYGSEFQGRLSLDVNTPSLLVTEVQATDNKNFWCQISLEGDDLASNGELGIDEKSVVFRIPGPYELPKFHSVSVSGQNVETSVSSEVAIQCTCGEYHCDDVFWYKGPENPTDSQYELVFSRVTGFRGTEPKFTSYNQWTNRAYLNGDSLVISQVVLSDAGRYWCEMRGSGYKNLGETGTDAKSVVLEVF